MTRKPIVLALACVLLLAGCETNSAGGSSEAPAVSKNISGTFVEWDPVDDGNGYALFSVTNNGTTAATATCTVQVRDDFGNFGFDSMVGEQLAPGETKNYRMPISMSKGALHDVHGEVSDC